MKRLIIFICCLVALTAAAKTPIVQMMEGEIRAGLTTPLGGHIHLTL